VQPKTVARTSATEERPGPTDLMPRRVAAVTIALRTAARVVESIESASGSARGSQSAGIARSPHHSRPRLADLLYGRLVNVGNGSKFSTAPSAGRNSRHLCFRLKLFEGAPSAARRCRGHAAISRVDGTERYAAFSYCAVAPCCTGPRGCRVPGASERTQCAAGSWGGASAPTTQAACKRGLSLACDTLSATQSP
jgi:hypothetical protein